MINDNIIKSITDSYKTILEFNIIDGSINYAYFYDKSITSEKLYVTETTYNVLVFVKIYLNEIKCLLGSSKDLNISDDVAIKWFSLNGKIGYRHSIKQRPAYYDTMRINRRHLINQIN